MRSRRIIVPIDSLAQKALDYDNAVSNQLIVLDLSNEDFFLIFKGGIIDKLNKVAGVVIDDFEDELILDKEILVKCVSILNEFLNDDSLKNIIQKLISLFNEAINRNTGIYFFF